jgi:hypothetical protein
MIPGSMTAAEIANESEREALIRARKEMLDQVGSYSSEDLCMCSCVSNQERKSVCR